VFRGGARPFRTPFPTANFTSSLPFCLCAHLPIFCQILRDGHGLCPEGSATLFRHVYHSKEFIKKSGFADESHAKDSGSAGRLSLREIQR
jgi:hypothetical protein